MVKHIIIIVPFTFLWIINTAEALFSLTFTASKIRIALARSFNLRQAFSAASTIFGSGTRSYPINVFIPGKIDMLNWRIEIEIYNFKVCFYFTCCTKGLKDCFHDVLCVCQSLIYCILALRTRAELRSLLLHAPHGVLLNVKTVFILSRFITDHSKTKDCCTKSWGAKSKKREKHSHTPTLKHNFLFTVHRNVKFNHRSATEPFTQVIALNFLL